MDKKDFSKIKSKQCGNTEYIKQIYDGVYIVKKRYESCFICNSWIDIICITTNKSYARIFYHREQAVSALVIMKARDEKKSD